MTSINSAFEGESLFDVADVGIEIPPSPLEIAAEKRREKEAARQRDIPRTQDERAASTSDLMGEWIQHLKAKGLSETEIPNEIKIRVGRSIRSLIKKQYLYEEIVYALATFAVRDLRDRKYTPRTGNIEIYARQYRGESHNEREANEAEQERLRQEALSKGQAPTAGTQRQNQRDASIIALIEAQRELEARKLGQSNGLPQGAPAMREIGP